MENINKILVIDNVRKSFSNNLVLDNISFYIDEGEIVGFLGRNGAGKSTLMKLICGLLNMDSGDILVMGTSIKRDREKVLENIGVSIESPALFENLSGRENLKLMANWRNIGMNRVKEMEKYSKLNRNLDKRVMDYSMGMKMRLMLSMVLLSKPKLLILDEPMNGLDPEGVFELRNALLDLKNKGCSILLSSHQLSELEKISDRIIMLENGKIVYNDVLSSSLKSKNNYKILTNNYHKALTVLKDNNINATTSEDLNLEKYIDINTEKTSINEIIRILNNNKIEVLDLEKNHKSLEDLYKELRESH